MRETTNDTAILFFSRSASAEAAAKNILRAKRKNRRMFHHLISHTGKLAARLDLPLYKYDEHLQVGETFGEKLSNAISQIFQSGYSKVVVIGNDCISLTENLLRKACLAVQQDHTVLGSTKKGGAYIIGINRNAFNAESFQNIRWQSSFTYQDLVTLYSLNPLQELEVLNDINTVTDLQKEFKNILPFHRLYQLILNCISAPERRLNKILNSEPLVINNYQFGLKAPPAFL